MIFRATFPKYIMGEANPAFMRFASPTSFTSVENGIIICLPQYFKGKYMKKV